LKNVIVWIDSFFELRCYGAMLWFSRVRDSWWFKISFRTESKTPTAPTSNLLLLKT
jgi:hypothetical protein